LLLEPVLDVQGDFGRLRQVPVLLLELVREVGLRTYCRLCQDLEYCGWVLKVRDFGKLRRVLALLLELVREVGLRTYCHLCQDLKYCGWVLRVIAMASCHLQQVLERLDGPREVIGRSQLHHNWQMQVIESVQHVLSQE
jgi:hypothetical protein